MYIMGQIVGQCSSGRSGSVSDNELYRHSHPPKHQKPQDSDLHGKPTSQHQTHRMPQDNDLHGKPTSQHQTHRMPQDSDLHGKPTSQHQTHRMPQDNDLHGKRTSQHQTHRMPQDNDLHGKPTSQHQTHRMPQDNDLHGQPTSQHQTHGDGSYPDSGNDLAKEFTTSIQLNEETIDLLGYHFNNEGELCDEAGCRFGQKGAKTLDPDTFLQLATKIMEFVQENLINVHGLEKIPVPVDATNDEPQSFIFASRNAQSTTGKLLILIHGSGNVVAGIWSKKVLLYDNLYKGSQLPYVEQAICEGYEVVVLNTNINSKTVQIDSWKGNVPIRGSSNPVEHALYVWDNFVVNSKAQYIAIVAHSFGGVVTTELAIRRKDRFLRQVFAVAFTDSVHQLDRERTPPEVVRFFCNNAKNWVTSDQVLDTPVGKNKNRPLNDAPRVSSGDLRHEWTSHSAFRSVFSFLDQKFKDRFSETPTAAAAAAVKPTARTEV